MSNASLTTRIDAALKAELEEIARFDNRSTSYMANMAIANLVDERRATRELVRTGLALVQKDAPSISSDAIQTWFLADDEQPFPDSQ
jgi:predicted transcriptional regulator